MYSYVHSSYGVQKQYQCTEVRFLTSSTLQLKFSKGLYALQQERKKCRPTCLLCLAVTKRLLYENSNEQWRTILKLQPERGTIFISLAVVTITSGRNTRIVDPTDNGKLVNIAEVGPGVEGARIYTSFWLRIVCGNTSRRSLTVYFVLNPFNKGIFYLAADLNTRNERTNQRRRQ